MLTKNQREYLENKENYSPSNNRVIRKRIIDKVENNISDMTLVFQHADDFPNLMERVSPEIIQNLIDTYFQAFKVKIEFSNPKTVIELMDENVVLQRKYAKLRQEFGDMVHRVEHFKYIANHATVLLEETRESRGSVP